MIIPVVTSVKYPQRGVRLFISIVNKTLFFCPWLYLEAVGSIWGVLWGFSCVELCVAAEEDSLQFAADG